MNPGDRVILARPHAGRTNLAAGSRGTIRYPAADPEQGSRMWMVNFDGSHALWLVHENELDVDPDDPPRGNCLNCSRPADEHTRVPVDGRAVITGTRFRDSRWGTWVGYACAPLRGWTVRHMERPKEPQEGPSKYEYRQDRPQGDAWSYQPNGRPVPLEQDPATIQDLLDRQDAELRLARNQRDALQEKLDAIRAILDEAF